MDQQEQVKNNIIDIIHSSGVRNTARSVLTSNQFISTIGGYAGTGKTHLIGQLRKEIKKNFFRMAVGFCTFTGKASSVLASKLYAQEAILYNDYIGTIHRMIYKPKTRWDKKLKAHVIVGWTLAEPGTIPYDLIIIDEASMVSQEIWKDLTSFGISIIAVGDHGQLGPVGDDTFNLMKNPEHKLTEIRRQARDSFIIKLSEVARKQGTISDNTIFSRDPPVLKLHWDNPTCQNIWSKLVFDQNTMALCGLNMTRNYINRMVRKDLKYSKVEPYPGERIVCLRNNRELGVMNGQTATVYFLMPEKFNHTYRLTFQLDGSQDFTEAFVDGETFDQVTYTIFSDKERMKKLHKYATKNSLNGVNHFDYGYCISVHKSQGSEWDRIILFEQRNRYQNDEQYARWLYTGITRAKEKLLIITNFRS
jgi:exodeoxyribonuclease-5